MNIRDIRDLIIAIDKTNIERVEIEKNDIKIMISKRVGGGNNTSETANHAFESANHAFETVGHTFESANHTFETADHPENGNVSAKITGSSVQELKDEIRGIEYNGNLISDENTFIIKSPMVGTFYKASGPENPPFVNVGDTVEEGQTLCIIEAMKIMNEIVCECEGRVMEILVEDDSIVEFGQPLMLIRR